mmetsp:Transcript_34664/g.97268  ORF Transcript_34664/g.97268 Transcript_34664/m.97268 type:complete len:109 (+) Transcript_34664:1056-1382(+)
MRHATLFWILQRPQAGGDLWFPRVDRGPMPHDDWAACDGRGVKLNGANGTIALLSYSLYSNGVVDEFSWHCSCPVQSGVEWMAKTRIWNQPTHEPPYAKSRHPWKREL